MADDPPHLHDDDLDRLLSMTMRIREARRADPNEVEPALEKGFAALIGLEAELSRRQARARSGSEDDAAAAIEVKARIEALRDALTDLRTLSVPPGEARIGFGFVLPDQHSRSSPRRN